MEEMFREAKKFTQVKVALLQHSFTQEKVQGSNQNNDSSKRKK